MQGKPTLHYFNFYAKGEPIRMALYKAGVEYTNNVVTFEQWEAFKPSPKLPYAQMPVLELEDGTSIAQMSSILTLLAELYPQLKSADPILNAKADSIAKYAYDDTHNKIGPMSFSEDADQATQQQALVDQLVPTFYTKLAGYLSDDKKFLTGDSVTIYDIQCAGMICNILTNPNHPNAAIFKASWDTAPERVKKYHADFCADMKPYLDNRPKDYMV